MSRKMIFNNLVKNSISAFYAAIEIHNKPNIAYRYETVTLLLINAWELALKAYVRKYIKDRSIYEKNGHTVLLNTALNYVNDHRNGIKRNSFVAIKCNIEEIEKYRNSITHFYCDELEPYIFMLVARSALYYAEFVRTYFKRDVIEEDGLCILPLGFKLPFKPEDFLSKSVARYASSKEAQEFIDDIISVVRSLNEQGIEESIVVGFGLYMESVKTVKNSDIIAAITSKEEADIAVTKMSRVKFSPDAQQVVSMSDDEFRNVWKYSNAELVDICKDSVPGFKQGKAFNEAKKMLSGNYNYVYERKLDNLNPRSSSKKFYTEEAIKFIQDYFRKLKDGND